MNAKNILLTILLFSFTFVIASFFATKQVYAICYDEVRCTGDSNCASGEFCNKGSVCGDTVCGGCTVTFKQWTCQARPSASYITISGSIKNVSTNVGISGVSVTIFNSDGVNEVVTTGSDGRYASSNNKFINTRDYAVRIPNLPSGFVNPQTTAAVASNSCPPLNGANQPIGSGSYECQRVSGGCGGSCDFTLTPQAQYITIGGRIVNENGVSIPNVKVRLLNSDNVVEDVVTGADGRFTSSANKFPNNRDYAIRPQTKIDGTRDENPETYVGLPKSTNTTTSAVNPACGGGNVGVNSPSYECQLVNGGCGTNCNFKYTSCSTITFPAIANVGCRIDVAGDGKVDINWSPPTLPTGYSISRYTMATWKGDLAADPKDYTNTYPTDNGKWTKYLCVDHGINKSNTSYSIPNSGASAPAKNWPNLPSKTDARPGRCDWAPLKDNTPAGSVSYRPATYKFADGKATYTGGLRYVIKDETSGKEVCKTIPNISSANYTCTFAPLDTVPPTPASNVRTEQYGDNRVRFNWEWTRDETCANCEENVGRCLTNGKSDGPNQIACDTQSKSPFWWQIVNERSPETAVTYFYNGNNKSQGLSWNLSDNALQEYFYSCPTDIEAKHDVVRIDVGVRDARGNMQFQTTHPDWPVVQTAKTTCCLFNYLGNANCDIGASRVVINEEDYAIWKCEYLHTNGDTSCQVPAGDVSKKWSDFDMNGAITLKDFEIWRQNK